MTESSRDETRQFFMNGPQTPLGRLLSAGCLEGTWRLFSWPMRTVKGFSLVYVTKGVGRFCDSLGTDKSVQAGDLILLFPGIAHKYGPKSSGEWNEIYAYFDGPVFDLCQQTGLLDPARPVHRQERVSYWRSELAAVLTAPPCDDKPGQVVRLLEFLSLLVRMASSGMPAAEGDKDPPWLRQALTLLGDDISLARPLAAIAGEVGMPYHTFRRRFERATGQAPAQYRMTRRIETACSMLLHTKMRIGDIAESLNFSDAHHFSNRFQAHTGLRPSRYRQGGRRGTLPPEAGTAEPLQRI